MHENFPCFQYCICFWDWYRMTRKRDTFLSLSYLFLHVLRSGETFFLSYSIRVCSKKDFVRSCSDHEQDLLTPEVLRGALTSTFFCCYLFGFTRRTLPKRGRTWNLVLVQKCFEYKIFLSHHEFFFKIKQPRQKQSSLYLVMVNRKSRGISFDKTLNCARTGEA